MTSLPLSLNTTTLHIFYRKRIACKLQSIQPVTCSCLPRRSIASFHANEFQLRAFDGGSDFLGLKKEKERILVGEKGRRGNKKRVVIVRVNQFGFNGGGGGDNGNNGRILGNLILAIGLTYLTMTDQLGWVLDTIVSIGLLAVVLPVAGIGAFLWWAGRNIVQDSCPNCGKDFQILRSSLNDGVQLCPYCTQPFSVEGDGFVRASSNFTSDQSTTFGQTFNGFPSSSKKGKASSLSVVDIEAEVRDVE